MYSHPLSDVEIGRLADSIGLPLEGIFMRNALPTGKPLGCYVFNTDRLGGGGTHWTAAYCTNKAVAYFDSFGAPPPVEIEAFLKRANPTYMFNNWIIQDPSATSCGLYCVAFLNFLHNLGGVSVFKKAEVFAQLFGDDTRKNEQILQEMCQHF